LVTFACAARGRDLGVGEGAGGAGGDALTAEFAVVEAARLGEGGIRHDLETAIDQRDRAGHHDLVADPGATAADDALVRFIGDEGVVLADRQPPLLAREPVQPGAKAIGQFLETAVAGSLAAHAVVGVIGQQEFRERSCAGGSAAGFRW